ncbi:hypothetical protein J4573_49875 [Actinomadura barringtoniae]|uniref:Uncharacterized protein n=1 Tax=Actinomadura barringtoniae TaxID=1427535 RepID=A0A939PUI3_9ACTN|nr:hypothetical protein [Actinomadura barringtoniae]MBO2455269.1 hypothetical protein [Actinomadura barringtoniae]
MRHILDRAVLKAIGQVNRLVFGLSRGQIVLYGFRGVPGILLTVTTPAEPFGRTADAAYLSDTDAYLILAHPLQETELSALLNAGTAVDAARGPDEIAVPADLDRLTDPVERATALKRVLNHASMEERAEVRRLGLTPVARLRLHQPFPETGRSAVAVSIAVEATEPTSCAQ